MSQIYDRLLEEDLNVGTQSVWVTAPSRGELRATQIGLHTFARGQQEWTAAWTPGAIAAGASASTTVTVPDSLVGDFVMAAHDKMLTSALRISGNVQESGVAQVVIHNPTAASITVAAGTVGVLVFPALERDVTPNPPTAEFTGVQIAGGNIGEGVGSFTDETTGGTPPYTYSWDFGDDDPGDTSTDQNPTYTYNDSVDPGALSYIFTVTLTVTDANGQTDDVTHDIEILFNQPI